MVYSLFTSLVENFLGGNRNSTGGGSGGGAMPSVVTNIHVNPTNVINNTASNTTPNTFSGTNSNTPTNTNTPTNNNSNSYIPSNSNTSNNSHSPNINSNESNSTSNLQSRFNPVQSNDYNSNNNNNNNNNRNNQNHQNNNTVLNDIEGLYELMNDQDPKTKLLVKVLGELMLQVTTMKNLVVPVGGIIPWHRNPTNGVVLPLPHGFELVDGSRLNYAGSIFNGLHLPDLNSSGRFIRGGLISGVEQDSANKSHNHGGNTGCASPGLHCSTTNQKVKRVQMHPGSPQNGVDIWRASFNESGHGVHSDVVVDSHSHTIENSGEDESRPKNLSMVFIIRVI